MEYNIWTHRKTMATIDSKCLLQLISTQRYEWVVRQHQVCNVTLHCHLWSFSSWWLAANTYINDTIIECIIVDATISVAITRRKYSYRFRSECSTNIGKTRSNVTRITRFIAWCMFIGLYHNDYDFSFCLRWPIWQSNVRNVMHHRLQVRAIMSIRQSKACISCWRKPKN